MERDYFIDDLRLIQEINEYRNQRNIPRHIKIYKIRKNPLEELEEGEFKTKYRFSKATAIFIIDMVRNDLAGDFRGGHVPPHIKVLCAIRTWARGEIQDDAADIIGISQPTVSLVCKQVALALVVHRAQWIKMPQNDLEQNRVIAGFYGICGFRQVVGAIDCTHIRIPKVGGNIGQYYINRKGYSSINVQVVANANLEIMDIVAHWRGSTHDSRIFNECRLKRRFEQSEFKGRLLGDSGYACSPYLFTPVLNPTTQQEERYNRAHIQTRNTVERCFGVWKQRFRCLLDGFKTKLDNTKLYIVALAILNNIAIHHRDMIENIDQPGNEDIPVIPAINNNIRGNAARAAFINDNF
ncbi:putative nuclease HARBI1 [Diabrotica virgifera virgifera]|uniref:DDE Tnp4 domain-containing protein n=1 Tax=Diabrotica virgifera virgifera TaxID=50390 RepID=A0ABM5JQ64_DIAVI|nr:putative nuclease HARBI1 [Diabrotica virgifera virgifera]